MRAGFDSLHPDKNERFIDFLVTNLYRYSYIDMQDDTFAQLVLQANAGDSASYGTLYEHFFTPVYRYVYARTLDRGIATDIAQDTFLKVYQQLGTRKLIHGTLYTYFITVARNTLYDWYRKKRPEFFSEEDEGSLVDMGATPVEEAIAQDDKMFLEQLLAKLPGQYREILILRLFEEQSYEAIATLTGTAQATVRKRYSRALELLRTYTRHE